MYAATIDDVIDLLGHEIDRCRSQDSRLGYFPALYRKVTIAVKAGIVQNAFEDGERMERLDVIFANRYLEAADQWARGESPTRSWRVAFEAAQSWPPIVLQHLLLGINAHINLDLAIAAAQTAPGTALPALQRDFGHINSILGNQVDDVKTSLSTVWPLLRFYNLLAGRVADVTINFSMGRARTASWQAAERLVSLSPAAWEPEIDALDRRTALLGKVICSPPIRIRLLLLAIRVGERGRVGEIIDLL
ncbi:MAG: hypothetical protein KF893_15510 [Caldilineaceae bacterium]|nr:hypothetical protein [Caldilineaceae bacterium]